jgi:hypothetical protein
LILHCAQLGHGRRQTLGTGGHTQGDALNRPGGATVATGERPPQPQALPPLLQSQGDSGCGDAVIAVPQPLGEPLCDGRRPGNCSGAWETQGKG